MPILISGSLAYDHIMDYPDKFRNHIMPENIHILNVSFVVKELRKSRGGTAGNIAYTVKLLGGEPVIVAALGRDGKEYLDFFKSRNIGAKYIGVDKNHYTSAAYITTDLEDNQITAFYDGVEHKCIPSIGSLKIKPSIAVISPTRKQTMLAHAREFAKRKIKIMFDPGQQITALSPAELREMIGLSHFVIGNDYEIKLLAQKTSWHKKKIANRVHAVIITLGEKGSLIRTSSGDDIEIQACRPKKIVDPTGAGDAYRAGFLVGYEKGLDLKTCGRMASAAASFAVEAYGTQEHKFSLKEFRNR